MKNRRKVLEREDLLKENVARIEHPEDIYVYVDLDGTLFEWCEGEDFKKPHYFRYLPAHKNVVAAIKVLLNLGINVSFATAVLGEEAIQDKRQSLNDLGFKNLEMISIPYGENKDKYLSGKIRILLDDYNVNLFNFTGIPIKLINNINHKKKTWKGYSVKFNDNPLTIANTILEAAKY